MFYSHLSEITRFVTVDMQRTKIKDYLVAVIELEMEPGGGCRLTDRNPGPRRLRSRDRGVSTAGDGGGETIPLEFDERGTLRYAFEIQFYFTFRRVQNRLGSSCSCRDFN